MTPRISIILPFFNAASTLEECLDSVAAQTLDNYEVVAIDDGSGDASAELVDRRARADKRIRLLRPGRQGLVPALNAGIAAAGAPYLARMDADDRMHPRRLEMQAQYLDQHREHALVASLVELFPEELVQGGYREYVRWQNACITPEEIAANIYVESPLAHPSVTMRRAALDEAGAYRDGPFPEDYELWLRMHHAGLRMAKIPQVLLHWREGEVRTSRTDPRYARSAFDRLRAEYLARDPRVQGGRPLVIWGAGRQTRKRAQLLFAQGLAPAAWVDVDPKKIGNVVNGIPVLAMDAVREMQPRPFVLIYVATHGARDEIAAWLTGWGYRVGDDFLAVG